MNREKIGYLRSNEMFGDLNDQEMEEVARVTTMTNCERGRIFYAPSETGEVLFLLKQGRVQIYRVSADGKKLVLPFSNLGRYLAKWRWWVKACTTPLPKQSNRVRYVL